MSKETRGMGASIVSGVGIAGSALAFLVAEKFQWRMAYWTGGALGLVLLFLTDCRLRIRYVREDKNRSCKKR